MSKRKYDLEDRLVDFICGMIDVVENLPKHDQRIISLAR